VGCIGGVIGAKSVATFIDLPSKELLDKSVGAAFIFLGIIMAVKTIIIRVGLIHFSLG
jgi:hypothetical protein